MSDFPHKAMRRLADQLAKGKVAFFIGAGFSLDSEGNSTERLIARLLVRFDAMTRLCSDGQLGDLHAKFPQMVCQTGKLKKKSAELRKTLKATFGLANEDWDGPKMIKYPYDCARTDIPHPH